MQNKTVKGKAYLCASMECWHCEEGEKFGYHITNYGASDGDIVLAEMDIVMEVPDDLTPTIVNGKFVEAMREQQETIKSEAALKCGNIEETIQRLLALPAPPTEIKEK